MNRDEPQVNILFRIPLLCCVLVLLTIVGIRFFTKGEIFCPNGPSANVTPMMENKCGDRLAMPSVSY